MWGGAALIEMIADEIPAGMRGTFVISPYTSPQVIKRAIGAGVTYNDIRKIEGFILVACAVDNWGNQGFNGTGRLLGYTYIEQTTHKGHADLFPCYFLSCL